MRYVIVLVVALFYLLQVGCTSGKLTLQQQELVNRSSITFSRSTPAQSRIGFEDPAERIQKALMEQFQSHFAQSKVEELKRVHPMSDLEGLKKRAKTDLALAYKTVRWELLPYLTCMNCAYLRYRGHARLIDLKTLKVIWNGRCSYTEDARKGIHRPRVWEFYADDGALIKSELNNAAEACVKQLSEQLF